jgi:hypothetical protein
MRTLRRICLVALSVVTLATQAQDNKGTGPPEKSIKSEIGVRKQQRREARERRKLEREERKAIKKHHKRIQTKKVQKRMKESRGKAIRNNEHRREPFYKRWFKRKHKSKPVKKRDD